MLQVSAARFVRVLSRATWVPVVWILLVPATVSAAEWYESYHLAEEALERQEWSDALRELNSALEQRPGSSARARTYGMRVIEYYPFLQLGITYYHLGQYDAARQALATELGQGEIEKSEEKLALLRAYQQRTEQAEKQSADSEERRRARVLADSLDAASGLEREGKLQEALAALDRGLAVAPQDPEARTVRQRLFTQLAIRAADERLSRRFEDYVRQGESELASGRYRQAAASFNEALELRLDDRVNGLLERALEGVRSEVARQEESARQRTVDEAFERAAGLAELGSNEAALAELQLVLAVDPTRAGAAELQTMILRAQADEEESAGRAATIARLLDEAERELALGRHDRALEAANGVLVVDPANAEALRHATVAYARLSTALLESDGSPPSIVLDRQEARINDDIARRSVRSAEISVSGTVYDRGPVEILVYRGGDEIGPAAVDSRELRDIWISEFTIDHRVDPGLSELEIVALDVEGNRATLRYEIDYEVPFVRSWGFGAAIAAGLAATFLAAVGWRRRRRHKLQRGRFNPYVAGAPILEHSRFFGRQQLLEYVLRRISNNSIMLYGERRIGKTSFQHRLKRCLESLEDSHHEYYPVYVDLQGTPQEAFFSTLAAEVFHGLRDELGGLEPEADLDSGRYGYRELVKDLHAILRALRAGTRKKVKLVLLIDEVDELNDYDPRVNQRLRSLFMRALSENLVAVVSGVAIKKQWEREGSPWYNFFQEIEVEPLDREEARSLIEAPVRGVFTFEDGVADEIIRRTHSKPYLIQRLCSSLVDQMHEQGRSSITVADVSASYEAEAA